MVEWLSGKITDTEIRVKVSARHVLLERASDRLTTRFSTPFTRTIFPDFKMILNRGPAALREMPVLHLVYAAGTPRLSLESIKS